jgi:hypothetical protein
MTSKTVEIGKRFKNFNLATGENVILEVVKAVGIMCDCCYFHGIKRHCPDEYACGQFARKDKTAVIFKYIGDAEK